MPGSLWNCMWLQWCIEKHTSWLGALTCIAPSHIAAHILADPGPVVVARDEFQGLGVSWVSRQRRGVASSDQIVSEFLVLGNIDVSLKCDQVVLLLPSFLPLWQCLGDRSILTSCFSTNASDNVVRKRGDGDGTCEMLCLQQDNVLVVVFPCFVLFASRQDVGLLH